jgi:low affinity Fe/Cu permease
VSGTALSVASDTEHEAERMTRQPSTFNRLARTLTRVAGSATWLVALAVGAVAWTVVGAATGFPRWWELAVTIGIPFLTLALLALVQHTQNHDSNAIELKLDELISSLDGPSSAMLRVEEASEKDLEHLQEHFGGKVDDDSSTVPH